LGAFKFFKEGDGMKFAEQKPEQKKQLEQSPKKEQLSKRDLDELMGRYRPTYTRNKGALRQK
jgi:hypothetical protein